MARVVHTGVVHAGGVHAGDACTGGARAGGVHAGDVHAGNAHAGGVHAGVVGTLSQSDYRWGHSANQITGVHRGCARKGCMCRGCVCRGCLCRGCACRGCVRNGGGDTQPIRLQVGTLSQSDYRCAQGVHTQGWWGHLANQITQGCVQGCVYKGCVQGVCMQGVHTKGWWGHLANQIMQGCTRRDVHAGGECTGVQGTLSQSDYTGLRVQGLCAGVVGTLSQSDYTGLRMQGLRTQGLHAQGCIEGCMSGKEISSLILLLFLFCGKC